MLWLLDCANLVPLVPMQLLELLGLALYALEMPPPLIPNQHQLVHVGAGQGIFHFLVCAVAVQLDLQVWVVEPH